MKTRTLEHCLACGHEGGFLPLAMKYEWAGVEFPAVECPICTMRFLRVQPERESLAALYSAEYFQTDFRCGRSDTHSFDEAAFRAENAGLLERFERFRGAGRLLEVGCASGWLLKHARERGWQVTGVELSADAVAHARGLGLDVRQGTLGDAKLPAGSFDLVFMGDVLEHVPDCRETSEQVAALLAPGGHFFLRGPITTHSLARGFALWACQLANAPIVLAEPPYHLWEFTPGSLRRLMKQVGLDVVLLEQAKIPPGRPHGKKSALQAGRDGRDRHAQRAAHAGLERLRRPRGHGRPPPA